MAVTACCGNKYVRVTTNWYSNTMLDLDLISTVEDPNLRLGNIDTSDPTMARERKLRQSNLRGEIFLLSNDNGTVEDYCIVQFLTFVIMTANRNTGPLGSLMANEVRGGSGNELAVGDPRSLQLHLIDLRITIGGRGRGVNEVWTRCGRGVDEVRARHGSHRYIPLHHLL